MMSYMKLKFTNLTIIFILFASVPIYAQTPGPSINHIYFVVDSVTYGQLLQSKFYGEIWQLTRDYQIFECQILKHQYYI